MKPPTRPWSSEYIPSAPRPFWECILGRFSGSKWLLKRYLEQKGNHHLSQKKRCKSCTCFKKINWLECGFQDFVFHSYSGKWSNVKHIFFRWVAQPPTRRGFSHETRRVKETGLEGNFEITWWAPASYKWGYNFYKWPYEWVTDVITLHTGVVSPHLYNWWRGPPCMSHFPGNCLISPRLWAVFFFSKKMMFMFRFFFRGKRGRCTKVPGTVSVVRFLSRILQGLVVWLCLKPFIAGCGHSLDLMGNGVLDGIPMRRYFLIVWWSLLKGASIGSSRLTPTQHSSGK